jgi:Holliday junction resolvase RusA-like endonuclease
MLVETWVPGWPKTKGSLTFRGNGYVEENVAGSKEWRKMVAYAARQYYWVAVNAPPHLGPVAVRCVFWLPRPRRLTTEQLAEKGATYARAGDIDKLARNVLDALQDAGVYADDNQVVRLVCDKILCGPDEKPGLWLTVGEVSPSLLGWINDQMSIARHAFLESKGLA